MMLAGNISKAYLIEDSSRFMDEAVSSYKDMLRKEVRGCCSRCQDGLGDKNPLSSEMQERAFKIWLEYTLRGDSIVPPPSHSKILKETDDGMCLKRGIVSPSVSVMTNYGGSSFSLCSSLGQCPEGQFHTENGIFLEDCYSKNEQFLFPPGCGNDAKSRTGSWSDSGYCCDKSDSDNSRFSSLSFSACFDTEDYPNQDLGEGWRNLKDEHCMENSKTESGEQLNEHFSGLQNLDMEHYNEEELKVLHELMNNPENFHETTKELSDMARDVSSKRKTSKTLSCIGRFFRNLVKSVRKCSTDNSRLKPSTTFELEDENRKANQRRWSIRSCPSPFQKRSSSVKTNGMFLLPVNKERNESIQRANSYSSLFGRKGSLFSHTERSHNSHVVKRSESCDVIRQVNFTDTCNYSVDCDLKTLAGNVDTEFFMDKKLDDLQPELTCICAKDGFCREVNSAMDFNERYETSHEEFDDGELVAPLVICVNKERSAHTRRIRKLSDDVFN